MGPGSGGQSKAEHPAAPLRRLYSFLQSSGAPLLYFWRAGGHLTTRGQTRRAGSKDVDRKTIMGDD